MVWYGAQSRYQSLGQVSEANTEAVRTVSRHKKLDKYLLTRIMNKPLPKKTSDQKLHKPWFKHRDLISIHKNNHRKKKACLDRSLAEKAVSWENITSPHKKQTQATNCIKILMGKIMDEYENSPDSDSGSRWDENIPFRRDENIPLQVKNARNLMIPTERVR